MKDAQTWLEAAHSTKDKNPRVACALAAHAVIKALDALFEATLKKTPTRHDNAIDFFRELLAKGLIEPTENTQLPRIQEILKKKSTAEYHLGYFSKRDTEAWIRDTEKIIKMVRKYVR